MPIRFVVLTMVLLGAVLGCTSLKPHRQDSILFDNHEIDAKPTKVVQVNLSVDGSGLTDLSRKDLLSGSDLYTVEEGDTLQKIAEKVYGTSKPFLQIYEQNRNVIKDPNFLTPGTVLQLPVLDEVKEQ